MGYNINEYGEIVGPKKAEKPHDENSNGNKNQKNWFARNYNWLWLLGLLAQIAFCISALSCSQYYEYDYEHGHYNHFDRFDMFVALDCIILVAYIITWIWSKNRKNNFIQSFIWLILVGCAIFCSIYMLLYCKAQCQEFIMLPCVLALSLWVLAISLSSGLK